MEVDKFSEVKKAYHEEYKNSMRITGVRKIAYQFKTKKLNFEAK